MRQSPARRSRPERRVDRAGARLTARRQAPAAGAAGARAGRRRRGAAAGRLPGDRRRRRPRPRARDRALDSRTAGRARSTRSALAAAVTGASIAIAVPIAWLTVRTDLPARRLWATLCTLPLVIPTYVGAYLFVAALGPDGLLAGRARGRPAAVDLRLLRRLRLCSRCSPTRSSLLPVRAALRRIDPQLEDAARAMGRGPLETFRTVVLPQLWPAIAVGGAARGAVRDQRLRRRLDHALRLVHPRDLHLLQVELRPHRDRRRSGWCSSVLMLALLWVNSRLFATRARSTGSGPAPAAPAAALPRSGAGAGRRWLLLGDRPDRAGAAGRRAGLLGDARGIGAGSTSSDLAVGARRELADDRGRGGARRRARGAGRRRARRPLPERADAGDRARRPRRLRAPGDHRRARRSSSSPPGRCRRSTRPSRC